MPIEFNAEALRYRGPDVARCYEIFSRLGFPGTGSADYAPTAATSAHDYAVVQSVEELDALAAQSAKPDSSQSASSPPENPNFKATSSVCRFRRRLRLRDTSHWDTLV